MKKKIMVTKKLFVICYRVQCYSSVKIGDMLYVFGEIIRFSYHTCAKSYQLLAELF